MAARPRPLTIGNVGYSSTRPAAAIAKAGEIFDNAVNQFTGALGERQDTNAATAISNLQNAGTLDELNAIDRLGGFDAGNVNLEKINEAFGNRQDVLQTQSNSDRTFQQSVDEAAASNLYRTANLAEQVHSRQNRDVHNANTLTEQQRQAKAQEAQKKREFDAEQSIINANSSFVNNLRTSAKNTLLPITGPEAEAIRANMEQTVDPNLPAADRAKEIDRRTNQVIESMFATALSGLSPQTEDEATLKQAKAREQQFLASLSAVSAPSRSDITREEAIERALGSTTGESKDFDNQIKLLEHERKLLKDKNDILFKTQQAEINKLKATGALNEQSSAYLTKLNSRYQEAKQKHFDGDSNDTAVGGDFGGAEIDAALLDAVNTDFPGLPSHIRQAAAQLLFTDFNLEGDKNDSWYSVFNNNIDAGALTSDKIQKAVRRAQGELGIYDAAKESFANLGK